MGINSYQDNFFAQEKQADLPLTIGSPVLYLRMTTFRKLPIIVPKANMKNQMRKSIVNIISRNKYECSN